MFPTTLKYPDRDGETSSVKYSPSHKWVYSRGMTPENAVLIKWSVIGFRLSYRADISQLRFN